MNTKFTDQCLRASVAIPVLNDREGLAMALDAVDRQSVRESLEIIVVDNGSTDGSFELARERADIADRIPGGRGSSAPRNRALELANAPHLLTLDADTWPIGEEWGRLHLDTLEAAQPDVLATAGPLIPAPSQDRFARREDITPHVPFVNGAPAYAVNGSACYRTEMLRELGGYPDLGANDSGVGLFARSRGLRYIWIPGARAYHRNAPGLKAYIRQMRKVGQYMAEQNPPPSERGRWAVSQTRHVLSRARPLLRGEVEEAVIGSVAAVSQTYGAIATWRTGETPARPWVG
jgi:glycosyltransferase involved in cell wall biosynthesis